MRAPVDAIVLYVLDPTQPGRGRTESPSSPSTARATTARDRPGPGRAGAMVRADPAPDTRRGPTGVNPDLKPSRTVHAPPRRRARRAPAGRPLYDELDRRIIELLQRDGRQPNTEIAHLLGVTETTIRKRIGRLLSEQLIKVVAG